MKDLAANLRQQVVFRDCALFPACMHYIRTYVNTYTANHSCEGPRRRSLMEGRVFVYVSGLRVYVCGMCMCVCGMRVYVFDVRLYVLWYACGCVCICVVCVFMFVVCLWYVCVCEATHTSFSLHCGTVTRCNPREAACSSCLLCNLHLDRYRVNARSVVGRS